jgi:hypothetical protein
MTPQTTNIIAGPLGSLSLPAKQTKSGVTINGIGGYFCATSSKATLTVYDDGTFTLA